MMMTTTGKKHHPLIITIIIVISKSRLKPWKTLRGSFEPPTSSHQKSKLPTIILGSCDFMTKDCKTDTTWKTFRDTNMTRTDKAGSQQWTAVSPFIGAHQHCVAKICHASPNPKAHKLQTDPFALSNTVLWTHLILRHIFNSGVFRVTFDRKNLHVP